MSNEEKTETVVIGRPVEFENVAYGKGTYKVTPRVAAALRARNATASVASHMAAERAKERGAEGDGDPTKAGVIIGGKPGEGEGGGEGSGGAGGTFSQPSTEPPAGGTSDANSPEAVGGFGAQTLAREPATVTAERAGGGGEGGTGGGSPDGETARDALQGVEALTGELPKDFPARDKLAKGNPDEGIQPVTRYEQLTTLSKEQLDKIPGVGDKTIEEIGQRLFADAQKASGGGGGGAE
jgi:hypothetical protein